MGAAVAASAVGIGRPVLWVHRYMCSHGLRRRHH
jgi:hypothetical protein